MTLPLLDVETRSTRDAWLTGLMVATFALLPLFEVRVTKTVALADVTLAASALVCLVGGPLGRPPSETLSRPFVLGVALFGVGGLFALVFSAHPLDSGVLLGRVLVAASLSTFVLLWWDPPGRTARRLLGAFVLGGAASAGFGALSATVLVDVTDAGRDAIDRATGLTGNANHLGALSAIGVCLALGLAATTRGTAKVVAWLLTAAVLGAGLLWSGSRSALVGVVVGAGLLGWHLWNQRRRAPVLLVLAAGGLVVLLAVAGVVRIPTIDRLLLRTDTVASTYSVASTEARWELARERIDDAGAQSLLVGSGMENRVTSGGHSGHLEIWVGTGLVGLAGWVLVCVAALAPVVAVVRLRGRLTPRGSALLVAGAGFAAHLATTVFLEHIWDRYIWLLVALVLVLRPLGDDSSELTEPTGPTTGD